jgi:plastocyanin
MKKLVLMAVVGLGLATAAPAGAATWQAWAGEPSAPPSGAPKGAELNQFFPRLIKIQAGDKIRYSTLAFHTVSYLNGSTQLPPGVMPDPGGTKYAGIKDAAGASFWFEGLTKFIYNPSVFGPVGSPAVIRGAVHSLGVIAASDSGPGSGTLSFPKPGSYKLVCQLHPGMVQTVVVNAKKPKKSKVDTKVSVKTRIAKESRAAWARAKTAASTPVPANTVFAGVDSGQTTLLAFLPATLTVPKGTTVTFQNMAPSEIHNEAFGPQDWVLGFLQQTDLLPLGPPGTPNQVSPALIYGTEPPGAYVYGGSNHGNGFLAPGLTDDQPGDPPNGLPQAATVTFTKAGTYTYFCMIHGPDMSGEIVVTG